MILYKLYQGTNSHIGTAGKWYARAAITETVGLDELAEHMANHNTPYSKGAIKGMLTDMVSCIRELLMESKAVKIPDLAIFSVGLKTEAADSVKNFNVARNIRNAHIKARGTGEFKTSAVSDDVVFKEYGEYTTKTTTENP